MLFRSLARHQRRECNLCVLVIGKTDGNRVDVRTRYELVIVLIDRDVRPCPVFTGVELRDHLLAAFAESPVEVADGKDFREVVDLRGPGPRAAARNTWEVM